MGRTKRTNRLRLRSSVPRKWLVRLNVYHVGPFESLNPFLNALGLGGFHTGVEIAGAEYTFAKDAGIFEHKPRDPASRGLCAVFSEATDLGHFLGPWSSVQRILGRLELEFGGDQYDLTDCNCNHFVDRFILELLGEPLPAHLNRLAYVGSTIRVLLAGPAEDEEVMAEGDCDQAEKDTQASAASQSKGLSDGNEGRSLDVHPEASKATAEESGFFGFLGALFSSASAVPEAPTFHSATDSDAWKEYQRGSDATVLESRPPSHDWIAQESQGRRHHREEMPSELALIRQGITAGELEGLQLYGAEALDEKLPDPDYYGAMDLPLRGPPAQHKDSDTGTSRDKAQERAKVSGAGGGTNPSSSQSSEDFSAGIPRQSSESRARCIQQRFKSALQQRMNNPTRRPGWQFLPPPLTAACPQISEREMYAFFLEQIDKKIAREETGKSETAFPKLEVFESEPSEPRTSEASPPAERPGRFMMPGPKGRRTDASPGGVGSPIRS